MGDLNRSTGNASPGLPMRNLLTNPLWQPADLGKPIPESPHAVSVCLPTWADNVGYEAGDQRVTERMQSGYPRFFYQPLVREWCESLRATLAAEDEDCLVFHSEQAARHFEQFLNQQSGVAARVHPTTDPNGVPVTFPASVAATAKLGWQHLGGGISSRQAEYCLQQRPAPDGAEAKTILKNRVAELAGVSFDDVYLFPSGMNAVFAVHRALQRLAPDRKSVQFGFPYVDTLKILQKIGFGAHFLKSGNKADLCRLDDLLSAERIAGLYTEFPSNPLLACPDLERLDALSRRHAFPLVLDETIAGFHNVDLLPAADVVCSSLTKFFSGAGDVTAGSVILNRDRPLYSELKSVIEAEYNDAFFDADAIVLERNSRDYSERMPQINATADRLVEYVVDRPEVESVFYPTMQNVEFFDRFRKPNGGYSGLFSLVLKEGRQNEHTPSASRFFDRLRVSKGPNLGTNFSLACPFTILAHYTELEFVESCGVSRWLIRVSVGLEPVEDLIERFAEALSHD